MKVADLRTGGTGVPQMFELEAKDREHLDEFVRTHFWKFYAGDVCDGTDRDCMLQQIEEVVERGGGRPEIEAIIDQYAADMGLELS